MRNIRKYYSAVTKQPTNHLYEEGKSYRVAVCTGSYATMAMKEKMPSYEFVDYKSNEECMNAVLTDEVDLALVATHSVDYYMGKHQYAELHTVMIDDFSWGLCIGVNQQCDPMLIQILNKGIASITANDMSQATTAVLVSASSNTKSIEDVIYSHPIIAIVFVSFIVALMLIILFLAIVRSRSRKQNKRLEEALTSAENANKFKSEFVSRISHDMRTPMNGILGLAELSKDEAQVDVLKQNMRKVGETGEYLLGLINDTLDFQKMESGKMTLENQVVYGSSLTDGIIDIIRTQAKRKDIEIQFHNLNANLDCYIRTDPVRVKQVFINLLSNAVKFTSEGGLVLCEVECQGHTDMTSHCVIKVKDTGIGMSEEFLKNGVFKAFSQEHSTETVNQGTGLGLLIAKMLVELMGGTIEVESELGSGTEFIVHMDFERVEKAQAEQEIHEAQAESGSAMDSLKGCKILIVEDYQLNAEIATKLLQKAGCIVTWKSNGQEGVEEFEQSKPHDYDLILMDMRMPVMDGLEATKRIRAMDRPDAKKIPIIAMTANAYIADMEISREAGMNAHISKPINLKRMYETIAMQLQTSHESKEK